MHSQPIERAAHDATAALKRSRNAELLAKSFKVIKVDVGNFDRNLDLAASYGNPMKKGIPVAVFFHPPTRFSPLARWRACRRSAYERDWYL